MKSQGRKSSWKIKTKMWCDDENPLGKARLQTWSIPLLPSIFSLLWLVTVKISLFTLQFLCWVVYFMHALVPLSSFFFWKEKSASLCSLLKENKSRLLIFKKWNEGKKERMRMSCHAMMPSHGLRKVTSSFSRGVDRTPAFLRSSPSNYLSSCLVCFSLWSERCWMTVDEMTGDDKPIFIIR